MQIHIEIDIKNLAQEEPSKFQIWKTPEIHCLGVPVFPNTLGTPMGSGGKPGRWIHGIHKGHRIVGEFFFHCSGCSIPR